MSLGPFGVTPQQIEGLGLQFTHFINRLLDVEQRSQQLAGHVLSINYNETTPDGGVDAGFRDSPGSEFMPAGDTAFQFKRSNFTPKACADEFAKASRAHEIVREGGSYVIAIASALPERNIEDRRKKVAAKAIELKLIEKDDRDRVRVYDANQLARWASRFPSLAVSAIAGGPGTDALDIDAWAARRTNATEWVADDARERALRDIQEQISSSGLLDLRVQGESGVGKTRLVLEALKGSELGSLVAYLPQESSLTGSLLTYIANDSRAAVLVVDECPPERHVKVVERLSTDPSIKLITIGPSGTVASKSPVVQLVEVGAETTDEFLKRNYPQMSPEARRFVTDHSKGNMRWTIVLADRVATASDAQAAELIARNDIEQFVASILPEGRDFFCLAVLALLERVGWDGELRYQLQTLADFADATLTEMEGAAARLEHQGLLVRQGRYRSVAPHPLAVFLAAEAWKTHSDRLLTDLLPMLDEPMKASFFGRAADLGRFDPVREVFTRLLESDGAFATLSAIQATETANLLSDVAVVIPDQLADHLLELISGASIEDLRQQRQVRRELVWTLEKLVWHSRTFERAASALLRLALAENESFANNATGTWVGLFATLLPGTSARPSQRLTYLESVAASTEEPLILRLVVDAAAGALAPHESVTVSGELQGGVLVDRRGTPDTYDEAGDYRSAMINLLSTLAQRADPEVAEAAESALIQAIHPMIDDRGASPALKQASMRLSAKGRARLRAEIEQLVKLHDRVEGEDDTVRAHLAELLAALPEPAVSEELAVVVQLRRWDYSEGELAERIRSTLTKFHGTSERLKELDGVLRQVDLPAAWEVGYAAARTGDPDEEVLGILVRHIEVNPSALHGFLASREDQDGPGVFDDFLDGQLAQGLPVQQRLAIAVRGTATPRARARVLRDIGALPISQAVPLLFGWQRNLQGDDLPRILQGWTRRIDSQQDYNAIVDWINLVLHGAQEIPAVVQEVVWGILSRRKEFPKLANQRWDWSQLARHYKNDRPVELGSLLIDLADSDAITLLAGDAEAGLLSECAKSHGSEIWHLVANRLLAGGWRLQLHLRGWFLPSIPVGVLEEWVGEDTERARLVASMASVGGAQPSDAAKFLLDRFGHDKQVAGSLYGDLVSGTWWGPESERIKGQIEQLQGWQSQPDTPDGAKKWAKDVIRTLRTARTRALQREAEERF